MLGATLTTHGGLIAAWTLEANSTANLTAGINKNNDVIYDPIGVTGTLTGVGYAFVQSGSLGVNTLNDPRTPPTDSANVIYGGNNGGGPMTLTIRLDNVAGLSGFVLTYAAANFANGSQLVEWSNDGSHWMGADPSSTLSLGSSWSVNTANFSSASPSGLGTMYFRDTVGAIGSSYAAFDNFQVTAVPEPINYALAAFGLCVGGISFGRRFVRKLTRA
jgi:hypothetical protein